MAIVFSVAYAWAFHADREIKIKDDKKNAKRAKHILPYNIYIKSPLVLILYVYVEEREMQKINTDRSSTSTPTSITSTTAPSTPLSTSAPNPLFSSTTSEPISDTQRY